MRDAVAPETLSLTRPAVPAAAGSDEPEQAAPSRSAAVRLLTGSPVAVLGVGLAVAALLLLFTSPRPSATGGATASASTGPAAGLVAPAAAAPPSSVPSGEALS